MAFDPTMAREKLEEWGAKQENHNRSHGWIYRKNGRYLIVHKNKQEVVISVTKESASGIPWSFLPEGFRHEVFKRAGTGKRVVKQYLGHKVDGILALKFSNAHDLKTVFDWYTA